MNLEFLKSELERAELAELESDEQLRQMPALIEKACAPDSKVSASDCARIVSSALALNERLIERHKRKAFDFKRLSDVNGGLMT